MKSIVFADSSRLLVPAKRQTCPQPASRQTNSWLQCRSESLSLAQSKHSNANGVNTLHMSVFESYSYFIGSRASLPSGQGILVITKKKKEKKNH